MALLHPGREIHEEVILLVQLVVWLIPTHRIGCPLLAEQIVVDGAAPR
jgi:hypothetical protein